MNPVYVKMDYLGIVGVDKKQRIVEFQHLPLLPAENVHIDVNVCIVNC